MPGERRQPKFIPPKDRGRPAEELDPAYWERMLAETADPERPTMAHAEEELGVHHGADGADEVTWDWPDPIDRQVAAKLREEGDNHTYMGSPESFSELWRGVEMSFQELTGSAGGEEVKVVVHASCMTGHDCVVVATKAGEKRHFNTRKAKDYDMDRLQRTVGAKLGVEVRFKP